MGLRLLTKGLWSPFSVRRKKGRDDQGYRSRRHAPAPQELAINLKPSTVQQLQGSVNLNGQRPDNYQGTSAQIAQINGGQIEARFASGEAKASDMVLRPGQRLEVVSQQPTITGKKPTVTGVTGESLTIMGEKPTELGDKLTDVGEKSTGIGEKSAGVGEEPVVIRTEIPNYHLPDNSLFKLNLPVENTQLKQSVPAPDNRPLVETDPQFTQLKKMVGHGTICSR
ncbi:hypothetical protein [Photorhabdus temperata]|uniref:hypothetical protein n=1 Tax=Photorhabdus temperata TaxID=574560 RepID=UPI0003FB1130|nr:hypothetical protein [Photorhabdus temperata]